MVHYRQREYSLPYCHTIAGNMAGLRKLGLPINSGPNMRLIKRLSRPSFHQSEGRRKKKRAMSKLGHNLYSWTAYETLEGISSETRDTGRHGCTNVIHYSALHVCQYTILWNILSFPALELQTLEINFLMPQKYIAIEIIK